MRSNLAFAVLGSPPLRGWVVSVDVTHSKVQRSTFSQFLKVEVVMGDFDSVAISAHGLLSDPSGIAGFLGQLNPVRFASTHDDPPFISAHVWG